MSSPQIKGDIAPGSTVLTGAVQVPPDFYTSFSIDIFIANYVQPLPLPFSLVQGYVPSDLGQRIFKLEAQVVPLPTKRVPNPNPQWITLASGSTTDPKWIFWNQFAADYPFGCSTIPCACPYCLAGCCQGITYTSGTGCNASPLPPTSQIIQDGLGTKTNLHADLSSLAYALSEQIRSRGALYVRLTLPTFAEPTTYTAGGYSVTAGASPKWHVEATLNFGNALPNTTSPNAFVTSYGKFDSDKWIWSPTSGITWDQVYNHPQQVALRSGTPLCGGGPNFAVLLHNGQIEGGLLEPDTGDCIQNIDFPEGAIQPLGPYLDPAHAYPYRAQLVVNTRSTGWESCVPWLSDHETGGCSADAPEDCCNQLPRSSYQYGRTGQPRTRNINFSLDGNPIGGSVFSAVADTDNALLDGMADVATGRRVAIEIPQSVLPLLVGSGHTFSFTSDMSFHLINSGEMYFALQTAGVSAIAVNVEFHAQTLVNNILSPITQNIDLEVVGQTAILNGTTGTASMPCTIAPQYNTLTDTTGRQWSFSQWQIYTRPAIGVTPVLLNTYNQPQITINYNQDITIYAVYVPGTPIPLWAIGAGAAGLGLLGAVLALRGGGTKSKSVAR